MHAAIVVTSMAPSWPLLVATHVLAFAAGAFAVHWMTAPAVRWMTEHMGNTPAGDPTPTTPEDHVMPNRLPRSTRFVIYLLVASIVVVGIGVQAYLNQRLQERDQAQNRARLSCIQEWGGELVDTVEKRTRANVRVEKAQQRRDRAEQDIFLVVLRLRSQPPEGTPADFDKALQRYAIALAGLKAAKDATKVTRQENPYVSPELVCD